MPDVAQCMEIAVQSHHAGRFSEAKELYRKVLEMDPGNCAALHSLGLICYREREYEQACDLVAKAIESNSDIPQFHNTMGVILESLGKFPEAIDDTAKAAE